MNSSILQFPAKDYAKSKTRRACFVRDSRAVEHGPGAWSDNEVLAALLGSSEDAQAAANALLENGKSLAALARWSAAEFADQVGVGQVGALRLLAAFEAGRRVATAAIGEYPLLSRADLVNEFMAPICQPLEVEKFWVLCLNRKNRLIRRVEITSGTATACLAHPREIFRAAIRESAAAIICCHNHPSGDPAPSAADIQITHLVREASKAVEITMLDHVIIGRAGADPLGRGYYSFREAGLL